MTKTKTKTKKESASGNSSKNGEITEPLSNFQELEKTGRKEGKALPPITDPAEERISDPEDHPSLEIKKIKLVNNIFLYLEFIENHDNDTVRNSGTMGYAWPVHEDLKKAFAVFRSHAAMLCGYLDHKKIKSDIEAVKSPVIDTIEVTQVSLGGAADSITITGQKHVYKKVFNFNSPNQKFYDETNEYKFSTDLELAWNDLVNEVNRYLAGHHGEGAAMELDFEGKGKKKKENINVAEESDHVELTA